MAQRFKEIQKNDSASSNPDWVAFQRNSPKSTSIIEHFEGDDRAFMIRSTITEDDSEYDEEGLGVDNVNQRMAEEDYTADFFRPLQQNDPKARAESLNMIVELLEASLLTEKKELVRTHIHTIVRMATEIPFDDIMNAFQKLLKSIEENGTVTIPKAILTPSTFIRSNMFAPVNTIERPYKKLFADLFFEKGRVSHINRVMALHPTYFNHFWNSFTFLMTEQGNPLPIPWRHYIAMIASAHFKCHYLIDGQEQEFLMNDGDPKWMDGIEDIPKKLINLLPIIEILSHQPWLLSKDHITPLVKGEDSWTIGELVHSMIIVCTFTALSGIVHGCGVTDEIDVGEVHSQYELQDEDEQKGIPMDKYGFNALVQSNINETKKLTELLKGFSINAEDSEEQPQEIFAKAETATINQQILPHAKENGEDRFARFVGKNQMQHEDFDVKSKTYNIFRVQDWNWKEDGFELARRFLPGAATLLDEEFDHIYTLTYNQLSQSTNVDTLPFRRAVWQYVQRVKGAFHDDYNYQEVNVLLNKSAKSYIKKICCFPFMITKSDFQDVGYALTPDEKVHVALLSVESSKQSSLLYGLHAVMKHMYNT